MVFRGAVSSSFVAVGAIILVLAALGLFVSATSKFQEEPETVRGAIEKARNGESTSFTTSFRISYNLCDNVGAEEGCVDAELGLVGDCHVQKGQAYRISAYPYENGVCLNISEVG